MGAAAEFAGGDLDKAGKASEGLNNAFARAKGGAKEQADAFRQLGIDTTKSMNSTDLMAAASAKLGAMAEGPQKAALDLKRYFGQSDRPSAIQSYLAKAKGRAKEQADAFRQLGVNTTKTMSASERMTAVSVGLARMAASALRRYFGQSARPSTMQSYFALTASILD